VSVVVCPLKALISEQVSALLRLKIPSTFINSDLDRDEKQLRYKLFRLRDPRGSVHDSPTGFAGRAKTRKTLEESSRRVIIGS
jgi:superfamily II DNA helicase RecQ